LGQRRTDPDPSIWRGRSRCGLDEQIDGLVAPVALGFHERAFGAGSPVGALMRPVPTSGLVTDGAVAKDALAVRKLAVVGLRR
jgi:hypothetical protein